jgi:hypothetical protein
LGGHIVGDIDHYSNKHIIFEMHVKRKFEISK